MNHNFREEMEKFIERMGKTDEILKDHLENVELFQSRGRVTGGVFRLSSPCMRFC